MVGKLVKLGFLGLVGFLFFSGCLAVWQGRPATPEQIAEQEQRRASIAAEAASKERRAQLNAADEAMRPQMTLARYKQAVEGMTYSEVIAIVGPPTKELSSSDLGGIRTVMYQWDAGFVANANMTFQNGKLVAKANFGL